MSDTKIKTSNIGNLAVTHALLHTDMDLTSKTVQVAAPSSDTHPATKLYVDTEVSNLIDSAPGTLDTLNELAAAVNDDANFAATVTSGLAGKVPLAGGTMTGDLDMGGNKVLFSNVYATEGDLPSASNNHGMFAHVHATGKGYYAHGGNWVQLANAGATGGGYSDLDTAAYLATSQNKEINGNVGIGTSNPGDKLEVSRTSTDQTAGLTLTNTQNGGYGSGIVWKAKRSDNSSILTAGKILVAGENSWNSNSTTSSQMQFWTQKDNTLTKHMTLTKNGNLGIGETSPSQKLHVSGNILLTGNLVGSSTTTEIGQFGSNSVGAIKRIRMTQGGELHFGDTTTSNFLGITEGTVNQFSDQDRLGIYYRNELKLYSNTNTLRVTFDSFGNIAATGNITTTGNVGIGVTDPSTKLHVDGNIRASGIYQEGGDSASSAFVASQGVNTSRASVAMWPKDHGSYPGQVHIVSHSANASADSGKIMFWDYNGSSWNANGAWDKDGKLGIGTTSPDAPLDVTRVGDGTIAIFQNTGTHGIEFSAPSSTALQIASRQGSKNLDLWANTLTLSAGGSESMLIDSSGRVGIGTSTNISSPLTVQSSGGGDSISIIGRANGIQDESVISFYENDGTTRNVYLLKERGDFVIATGEGGSPSEGLRVTEHRTVKTPVNITQGGTNGNAVSSPNAGYLGSSGANFGTTAIFRTPTITSSASNAATSQFLTIYSSGHWGEFPTFRFRVYGTYYVAGYREYVGQVVASSASLIEVQNNSGSSYVGNGGNNTITMSNAISSGLASHAGQPRYKREFTLTSHGIYGRCYVVVEIAYGGNRYYSSSTSTSTLDANGNSGGSYHFKTIPVATGGGIMNG